MSDCSSFVTPEDLAQIRADYRKARWLMTEGRDNIVKAAVEWAEARYAQEWAMCEDEAIPLAEQRGIEERLEDAEDALKEARRWKEAQA